MSEQMTDTLPNVSTLGSFLTMALRFDIRSTPSANVTVTTMGRPSGIAATASETGQIVVSGSMRSRGAGGRTSDCKHLEPASLLPYTNHADHPDDSERNRRQLLCEFVHGQLQRRLPVPDLLIIVSLTP